MSTKTKNFNLIKPELTDAADITATNQNWDKIDQALKECAVIPVTNDVPEDTNIWIDPDDTSIEEEHINNTNNPHNVTSEQVGAISRTLIWENSNPFDDFEGQTLTLPLANYDGIEVVYSDSNVATFHQYGVTGFIPLVGHKIGNLIMINFLIKDFGWESMYERTLHIDVDKSTGVVDNSLQITSCQATDFGGGNARFVDDMLKPIYIYGIKGVR